ncbi:MAG: penicillin-binding transpeptidase domain-containing protein [Chitinophagaceae bacterium]
MKNLLIPILISLCFFACSPNNVKQDKSLEKYFTENKVNGCFAMMNNGTGEFTVYGIARYRDSSYLPASTFKIVNSLVGLQTGIISNDSMVIKWDGVKRRDAWDKDLTMYEAFRVSSVPYYQEVARRIGKDTMQHWLDSISYGTKKINSRIDSFWLDNSLKITPDEQLGLVKRLYFNQLPFFPTYQKAVKQAMLMENNANYRLGFKTGWGQYNEKQLGWMVGWIEENQHPYFFVLNIESPDANIDMVNVRMKMLKDILKDLGFFEGRM